jgi:hypothetical protein
MSEIIFEPRSRPRPRLMKGGGGASTLSQFVGTSTFVLKLKIRRVLRGRRRCFLLQAPARSAAARA